MNNSDGAMFRELLNATSDYYGKEKVSGMVMSMYFSGLDRYPYEQVEKAVSAHMQSPEGGQFMPKIADIIRAIDGKMVTTDEVISAARAKDTPMGVLCRIQIGSYDLDNQTDMFYLKQRAQECVDKMAEWRNRALEGDYTDHEISMMLKFNVQPSAKFHYSISSPSSGELIERVKSIENSGKHQFLMEPPDDKKYPHLEAHPSLSKVLKETQILIDDLSE